MCGPCQLSGKVHFLNMKQYNGDDRCQYCKLKGYRFENNKEMRTTNESLQLLKEALKRKVDILNVKGPTVFSKIIYKYIETTAVDVIHCIYVEITKRLGWFELMQETIIIYFRSRDVKQ